MTSNYTTPSGDFFYTCESHIKDRNFASALTTTTESTPAQMSSSVSQAEVDQAIKEHKELQKVKEKEKDKDKESKEESKDSDKEKDSNKTATNKTKESQKSASASSATSVSTATPEPQYFELHKNFYDMRLRLHLQKSMATDAQTRKSQLELPATPTSRPSTPAN